MNIQYFTKDKRGLIPFKEWNELNQERDELHNQILKAELAHLYKEVELAQRYRKALTDIHLFKEGKLKTRPIQELLDEL